MHIPCMLNVLILESSERNPLRCGKQRGKKLPPSEDTLLQHALKERSQIGVPQVPNRDSGLTAWQVSNNSTSADAGEETYCWCSCQTRFCLSLTSAQAVNKRQQIRRGGGFAGFLSKFRQCAGFCNELRGKKTVSIPSSLPPACLSSQEASSTCQWHHPRSPPVLSLLIQRQIHRCVYML